MGPHPWDEEAEDDDEDSEDAISRGTLPGVMLCPRMHAAPISLPDGAAFLVAPMLLFAQGRCVLRPTLLSCKVDAGSMTMYPRQVLGFECDAAVWSASSACRVQGLGLDENLHLTEQECAALFRSSRASVEGGVGYRTLLRTTLRLVVAVRCTRRFWELPLS